MASVKIGYINIAETGTVTAVATNSSYPLHRLYDRYWNINWKSGSTGITSTTGSELVVNGGFADTSSWTTPDECTLSSVSGGQSGNALTINYVNNTDGSDLVTNGTFESVVSPWTVGSSDYTASIVGSGQSGNAVNINNSTTGSNLLTNPGFEDALGAEWVSSNATLNRHSTVQAGSYAVALNHTEKWVNLITNGTMEAGTTTPTGWINSGSSLTRSTTYFYKGVASLQCICSPATDYVYQDVTTTVGKTYKLSCWVRRSTTGSAALTAATTAGVTIKQGVEPSAGTTFKFIEFFFVATETTTRVCLGLIAATFQYDEVEMYEVEDNLLTNPYFDDASDPPTGWTAYGSSTITKTSTYGISGSAVSCVAASGGAGVKQTVSGLTVGQDYLLIVHFRHNTALNNAYCGITGMATRSLYSTFYSLLNWNMSSILFTATATSHEIFIFSYNSTSNNFIIDEMYLGKIDDVENYDLLLGYGDMEIGDPPKGWGPVGTFTSYGRSTTSYEGTYSYSFVSSTASGYIETEQDLRLYTVLDASYIAYAYVRRSASGNVLFRVYDNTSSAIAFMNQTVSTSYTLLSLPFVGTGSDVSIRIYDDATGTTYFDSVKVYKVSSSTTNYPNFLQTVSVTPDSTYLFSGYYRNGAIGDYSGQSVSLIICRGSNGAVYDYENYNTTASYLSASKSVTIPSDETTMKFGFRRNTLAGGDSYFDSLSLYILSDEATQYIEQTVAGLTSDKRYRVAGYVLKPTIADDSDYSVGVYRVDTSALISSISGTATTSWVAFSNLDFTCPTGQTSVKLRLIRNSVNIGDMRFDTVSCYHLNYAPNGQSARQTITTTSGYNYRLSAYVRDGITGTTTGLTSHPYEINVYNSSTSALIDSDSGTTQSSWSDSSLPITIDFEATSSGTIIELKKDSDAVGNIAFDTVSVYRILTSYEDQWVRVNQASSPIEIDTIIIPSGHHLNGVTCTLQYSSDAVSWSTASLTTANPWTQSGTSAIIKYLSAPQTANYWQLYMTGASSDSNLASLGELYLTKLYTLVSQPKYDLKEGYKSNISKSESDAKKIDYFINGTHRKVYEYTLPYISSTEKTYLEGLRDACMHKKPFFIIDHQGNSVFVELTDDIYFTPLRTDYYTATLKLMESL